MSEPLPSRYPATLAAAKKAIQAARTRAVLAANSELIGLYWQLGRLIVDRRDVEGWGTRAIERLSTNLRAEFPEMKGLARGNLGYMRRLATAWADHEVCLRVVGKLPWGHIQTLLDKLDQPEPPWL
jgi:predicted nuclease of restriction endonuclease-like (RecB) superfamily